MHVCLRYRSSNPLRFYDVFVFEKQENHILTKQQLISHQVLFCSVEL